MGLPLFTIAFTTSAVEAIVLASRGFVCLVIKDATQTAGTYTYKSLSEVTEVDYDAINYDYLENIFRGTPTKVKVVVGGATAVFGDVDQLILDGSPDVDYLVTPAYTAEAVAIISFVTASRVSGAKIKAVIDSTGSDKEYIIDTDIAGVSFEGGAEITGYEARIAGVLAGLEPTRSATYFVLTDIDAVTTIADPDASIDAGQLILVNDGEKIKIARGVNSFVSVTPSKGALFTKIKNVETMDMIAYTIRKVVADDYVGKFTNSLANKNLVLTAINTFLRELSTLGYIDPSYDNKAFLDLQAQIDYAEANGVDTTGMNETELKKLNTGDNLYISINCKLLDTMEDVIINVYL